MKTVEVDYQTEKVLNRICSLSNNGLNLMERMEIALFVEMLRNTPSENCRPEWRTKYNDIMEQKGE